MGVGKQKRLSSNTRQRGVRRDGQWHGLNRRYSWMMFSNTPDGIAEIKTWSKFLLFYKEYKGCDITKESNSKLYMYIA